jgi:pyruvate formate-lyase activating enzyme-like uncharacterized protein
MERGTMSSSAERSLRELHGTNFHVGDISPSCKSCLAGRMLVIGVTELCHRGCYYCPNPEERADKSYVGDHILRDDTDLLRGAELIEASAACLTGGEPLLRVERTLRFITILKKGLGDGFHLHLYTSLTDVSDDVLRRLCDVGLDEVRFHLHDPTETGGLERALRLPWRVGIEIPCIPSPYGQVSQIVGAGRNLDVRFVNLNEFHMAPSNYDRLCEMGFEPAEPLPLELEGNPVTEEQRRALLSDTRYLSRVQVVGSRELAMKLLADAESWDRSAPWLHFCSSNSKFSVQKINRDKRRALAVAKPCDDVTDTGMLLFGRIICKDEQMAEAVWLDLKTLFGLSESRLRRTGRLVELPWHRAARLKRQIVERFPEVSVVIQEVNSYQREADE